MLQIPVTAWRVWALILAAWFFYLEVRAIRNDTPGDTLSEYVWNSPDSFRLAVVVLCGWLVVHFSRGKKVE